MAPEMLEVPIRPEVEQHHGEKHLPQVELARSLALLWYASFNDHGFNVQAAVAGTPKPVETFLRKAGADFESKKAQQAGYKRDFNALIFGSLSMVPQKLALPSSTGLTRLLPY